MEASTIWWLIAAAFIIPELLTGSFFLLFLAVGAAAGALAAHLGFGVVTQLVACATFAVGLAAGWRRWQALRAAPAVQADSHLHLDIGQVVRVTDWDASGRQGFATHRGSAWRVVFGSSDSRPEPGVFRIVEVRGNQLVVVPV